MANEINELTEAINNLATELNELRSVIDEIGGELYMINKREGVK